MGGRTDVALGSIRSYTDFNLRSLTPPHMMNQWPSAAFSVLVVGLIVVGLGSLSGCTSDQQRSTAPETSLKVPAPSADSTVVLDVPYVGTPQAVVDRMLRLADVSEDDVVYDLGSGDGRIVITAAQQFGARGVGIEIDPERVEEARENAEEAGVTDQVEFRREDLFKADFSDATVVTLYLLSIVNRELRSELFAQLDPGDRVVSHDFDMGSWEPDTTVEEGDSEIHLWTIPEEIPEAVKQDSLSE